MTEEQGARLKQLRLKRGFERAADAARAYGWPVTTYQAHENGSRGIKMDAARRYAKAFNSTAAYVLTGDDAGPVQQAVNHVQFVPLAGKVAAGTFSADEGFESTGIQVPVVPRPDIPAGVQYAVVVDGTSVNLRIPHGAYAICAPFEHFPGGAKHGQLVHVVRERAGLHEHTIKELQFTRAGMILMPVSSDPRWQERIQLSDGDDVSLVRIHGVVIGAFYPF